MKKIYIVMLCTLFASTSNAEEHAGYSTDVVSDQIDLHETGSSTTVIDRDTLEALPGGDNQSISHVVETQPGLVADTTTGYAPHVRGADGGVMYVLDGIPLLASPLGDIGSNLVFLPTRLVQRLRVITGGFPVEYSYALSGVIDITTRKATGGPMVDMQLTYGTYNTVDTALNYSQQLGKLSLFTSGDIITTQRGFDTPNATPIIHDSRLGGNGFLKLDYDIDQTSRFALIATYAQDAFQIPIDPTILPLSQAPPGAVRGTDRYGNDPPVFVPYNAKPTEDERNIFAALSYHYVGDVVSTQVSAFVRESYNQLNCDPHGSLGVAADKGSSCTNVKRDTISIGALTHVSFILDDMHTLKAGAIFDGVPSKLDYTTYFSAAPVQQTRGLDTTKTLSGSDTTDTVLAGAYVQDTITAHAWTFLPGVRLDMQRTTFGASNLPALVLIGPSARLGASYAIAEGLLLHGFFGYLWQAPNTMDGPVAAKILLPTLANENLPVDLKAEKSWASELGIAWSPQQTLTLGLTGWGRVTTDQLDRQNIGSAGVIASYNFAEGRAVGAEISATSKFANQLDAFANVGFQIAQGRGVSSMRYLFSPDDLAATGWVILDHVQTCTANAAFDFHDTQRINHLSLRLNYGSGFHTGSLSNQVVPQHTTFDMTLSHRFDLPLRPEIALDVLNIFDDIYAYRIGTGFFSSAYAPLRRVNIRLIAHFYT